MRSSASPPRRKYLTHTTPTPQDDPQPTIEEHHGPPCACRSRRAALQGAAGQERSGDRVLRHAPARCDDVVALRGLSVGRGRRRGCTLPAASGATGWLMLRLWVVRLLHSYGRRSRATRRYHAWSPQNYLRCGGGLSARALHAAHADTPTHSRVVVRVRLAGRFEQEVTSAACNLREDSTKIEWPSKMISVTNTREPCNARVMKPQC